MTYSPFNPPQYSYGGGAGRFLVMEVVSRDDPEQAGRVQCRVFGYQNDKGNIPDQDLLWARPVCSPTNPMNGGIGTSPTGPMVGTYLFGYFLEGSQQLVYTGSIGKSGNANPNGTLNTSDRNHDTPRAARDETTGGGDFRFDSVANNYGQNSLLDFARNEAPAASGRTVTLDGSENSNEAWSLGTYVF